MTCSFLDVPVPISWNRLSVGARPALAARAGRRGRTAAVPATVPARRAAAQPAHRPDRPVRHHVDRPEKPYPHLRSPASRSPIENDAGFRRFRASVLGRCLRPRGVFDGRWGVSAIPRFAGLELLAVINVMPLCPAGGRGALLAASCCYRVLGHAGGTLGHLALSGTAIGPRRGDVRRCRRVTWQCWWCPGGGRYHGR